MLIKKKYSRHFSENMSFFKCNAKLTVWVFRNFSFQINSTILEKNGLNKNAGNAINNTQKCKKISNDKWL